MGNPFFGLTSQLLVSFLAICFMGSIWDVPGRSLRFFLRIAALLAVVLVIAWALPNPATDRPERPPVNGIRHSINRQVVQTVDSYVRENELRGVEELKVLVTFAGDVNDAAMTWIAQQEGLPYQFSNLSYSDSLDSYVNASKGAAFLVAADHDVAGVAQWIPSNKIADQILAWIRKQPEWSLVRAIEADDGLSYFAFANSENIRPFRSLVSLTEKTKGFLAIEGPYPEGLGIVRWGIAPESSTVFRVNSNEQRILELSGRSFPGQTMTILLNGTEQHRHTFTTNNFEDFAVPLAMTAGDNELTLRYARHLPVSEDDFARAVLFRKISLLQPGPDQTQQPDDKTNSKRSVLAVPKISPPPTKFDSQTEYQPAGAQERSP